MQHRDGAGCSTTWGRGISFLYPELHDSDPNGATQICTTKRHGANLKDPMLVQAILWRWNPALSAGSWHNHPPRPGLPMGPPTTTPECQHICPLRIVFWLRPDSPDSSAAGPNLVSRRWCTSVSQLTSSCGGTKMPYCTFETLENWFRGLGLCPVSQIHMCNSV